MFNIFRSQEAQAPLLAACEQADPDFVEAIVRAVQKMDRRLQTHPHKRGESRGDGVRILIQAPVGVLFQVDDDSNLVRILRSWTFAA